MRGVLIDLEQRGLNRFDDPKRKMWQRPAPSRQFDDEGLVASRRVSEVDLADLAGGVREALKVELGHHEILKLGAEGELLGHAIVEQQRKLLARGRIGGEQIGGERDRGADRLRDDDETLADPVTV